MSTSDFCEGVKSKAEIFGEEVAREVGAETAEDALEVGVGEGEGFVVARVGDDDVCVGGFGD